MSEACLCQAAYLQWVWAQHVTVRYCWVFCLFLSISEIKVLELNRKIRIFFFFKVEWDPLWKTWKNVSRKCKFYTKSQKSNWFPASLSLHWIPNNTCSGNCFGFVSFNESLHCDLIIPVSEILRWRFMIVMRLHTRCVLFWKES